MRNMLDQFYSYLSDTIIEFFKANPLSPGAKYNIQFEKREQVEFLYEELKKNDSLYKEFKYTDKGEVKYTSYLLNYSNVKLIISATIGDIQPDFLLDLEIWLVLKKDIKIRLYFLFMIQL